MKAGIALGSNLGDRAARLAAAKRFLSSLHAGPGAPLCSALYETEPVDCAPGTAAFLNAVVEIKSPLEPLDLLARLREFERQQGRALDGGRNTPRQLDLDLLYAGDNQMDTPALVLPHPRMTTRRFVLQPLAEIRPDLVLPGHHLTVAQLLAALPASPAARPADCAW
jgi:2-amino-4-hydroxy-6-hydroxymethyldihydropteridine diphosphokinase